MKWTEMLTTRATLEDFLTRRKCDEEFRSGLFSPLDRICNMVKMLATKKAVKAANDGTSEPPSWYVSMFPGN